MAVLAEHRPAAAASSTLARLRRWGTLAVWAGLAWVALFWRLGAATFWDPDEAHYAVTTRELLQADRWLVPTYGGEPFFDKPILFHHLQALTMLAAGQNELGARLAPALAALALIGTVWWLAATVWDRRTAGVAALVLTMCPALAALARYAIVDLVFTAWLFGGVAALFIASRTSRWVEFVGYACLALAVLTKGPVALVLAGLTAAAGAMVSPGLRVQIRRLHWMSGLTLIVVIAAPWFLLMWWWFGSAFVQVYVLNENLLLFSKSLYANQPGWRFYPQIVALGMLPWTPVLVGRLFDRWTRVGVGRRESDVLETLLWIWTAMVIGFFSVSRFKLDHYVFPVTPALALLVGRSWRDGGRGTRFGFACVGPTFLVGAVILGVLFTIRLDVPKAAWVLPLTWFALGTLLTSVRRVRNTQTPQIATLAFIVFYAVAVGLVLPVIERQKVIPEIGLWVAAHVDANTGVCGYRLNRWNDSLTFYAGRAVSAVGTADHFDRLAAAVPALTCVTTRTGLDELLARGRPLRIVYERVGLWATSGRALWRGRRSQTTFVVFTVVR